MVEVANKSPKTHADMIQNVTENNSDFVTSCPKINLNESVVIHLYNPVLHSNTTQLCYFDLKPNLFAAVSLQIW